MSNQDQTMQKTILIVDDTPENLLLLKELLNPFYRVQIAPNGRLAIKIALAASPPDLILLDIMMPEMDGYEVCQHLKQDERSKDIPILFVTAKSEAGDETKGFELGAADYIIKPISPAVVLARIKTHLAMSDQKKLLADQVAIRTEQLNRQKIELEETQSEVIRQLGRAAEYRDNETGQHIQRMSLYSRLLAIAAGLSESEADEIMHAAPMHDVGKIGIPDHILLKPGKLTDEEYEAIKKHPEIGFSIIGTQKSKILSLGAIIAYTHHEKWNGFGYPRGLKGEEIPIEGRICAISDVFDALTSIRPYKKAWTLDGALELIEKEAGEHFDPRLAKIFLTLKPQLFEIMQKYQEDSE